MVVLVLVFSPCLSLSFFVSDGVDGMDCWSGRCVPCFRLERSVWIPSDEGSFFVGGIGRRSVQRDERNPTLRWRKSRGIERVADLRRISDPFYLDETERNRNASFQPQDEVQGSGSVRRTQVLQREDVVSHRLRKRTEGPFLDPGTLRSRPRSR